MCRVLAAYSCTVVRCAVRSGANSKGKAEVPKCEERCRFEPKVAGRFNCQIDTPHSHTMRHAHMPQPARTSCRAVTFTTRTPHHPLPHSSMPPCAAVPNQGAETRHRGMTHGILASPVCGDTIARPRTHIERALNAAHARRRQPAWPATCAASPRERAGAPAACQSGCRGRQWCPPPEVPSPPQPASLGS